MINKTAVIGHGPSLNGANLGWYIDSFRYVLRIPHFGGWQKGRDYGCKVTAYCCTVNRARKAEVDLSTHCFVWSKRKNRSVPARFSGCESVSGLIQRWQDVATLKVSTKYPYIDHGTGAICVAADRFGLDVVVLGCDVLSGGVADKSQYVRGDNAPYRKTGHGWHEFDKLRSLVDIISAAYGLKIEFYDNTQM